MSCFRELDGCDDRCYRENRQHGQTRQVGPNHVRDHAHQNGETTVEALPIVRAAAVTMATFPGVTPGSSIATVNAVGSNIQKQKPSTRIAAMIIGMLLK